MISRAVAWECGVIIVAGSSLVLRLAVSLVASIPVFAGSRSTGRISAVAISRWIAGASPTAGALHRCWRLVMSVVRENATPAGVDRLRALPRRRPRADPRSVSIAGRASRSLDVIVARRSRRGARLAEASYPDLRPSRHGSPAARPRSLRRRAQSTDWHARHRFYGCGQPSKRRRRRPLRRCSSMNATEHFRRTDPM